MKILLRDKLLVTWLLLFQLGTVSNTFFTPGMEASFKTYTDSFQGNNTGKNNSSHENILRLPSRFDIASEKPRTLKEYIHEIPNKNENYKPRSYREDNKSDSKIVVVANTGERGIKGAEWKIVAEPRTETLTNQSTRPEDKNYSYSFESDLDRTPEKDDELIQEYLSDQEDLLYTFKDFVNIGTNPSAKEKLANIKSSNDETVKTFDVTYVMPIPKTRKYFEIKMSNLTEVQYNEINSLIQDHMRNKTQKSSMKNKDAEIVYVDIDDSKKYVTSRDLTLSSSLPDQTMQSIPTQNSSAVKNWLRNPEEVLNYLQTMFSEDGHNKFKNLTHNLTLNDEERSGKRTGKFGSSTTPPVMKNNGFHAEIATDYVYRNGPERNQNSQTFNEDYNTKDNFKSHDSTTSLKNKPAISDSHDMSVATATSILSSVYKKRNITKLTQIPSSGKPADFHINTSSNRRIKTDTGSSLGLTTSPIPKLNINVLEPLVTSTLSEEKRNKNDESFHEATHNINLFQTISPNTNESVEQDGKENTTLNLAGQDWTDFLKLYSNDSVNTNLPIGLSDLYSHITPSNINLSETTPKFDDPELMNLMQAAKWIFKMKKQMQEERNRENERYMSYIKKYVEENNALISREKGGDSNVMKIRKQDDILEELKLLMLRYFATMNFKTDEDFKNSNSSEFDSLLKATNVFELMDRSTQLVKLNLQRNIQIETNEPMGFVRRIVEKQIEKCNRISNSSLLATGRNKRPEYFKKNNHRRFLRFTNCMNLKMKRCVKGFTMWLERGKFYLRAQFNLVRAYENYEIERNLYCLRTYNASSLDTNMRGVRVRPKPKIHRKSGSRKVNSKQRKTRFRMRKINNVEHEGKAGGRNWTLTRKNMKKQENIQLDDENRRRESSRA